MEMTGERLIPAARGTVWHALNDPEILKASIPGCTSLVKEGDTGMTAVAALKVGPISAKFSGKVQLLDLDPPNSYRIVGEGQGGVAGFAKGGATVRLSERDGGTLLEYSAEMQIGGKMAQLGARLIDSTAKQMTNVFFDRFVAAIVPPEPAAAPIAATTVPSEEPVKAPATSDGPVAALTPAATPAKIAASTELPPREPVAQAVAVPSSADKWHGGSILLGVVTGAAIALIAVAVGHGL